MQRGEEEQTCMPVVPVRCAVQQPDTTCLHFDALFIFSKAMRNTVRRPYPHRRRRERARSAHTRERFRYTACASLAERARHWLCPVRRRFDDSRREPRSNSNGQRRLTRGRISRTHHEHIFITRHASQVIPHKEIKYRRPASFLLLKPRRLLFWLRALIALIFLSSF